MAVYRRYSPSLALKVPSTLTQWKALYQGSMSDLLGVPMVQENTYLETMELLVYRTEQIVKMGQRSKKTDLENRC